MEAAMSPNHTCQEHVAGKAPGIFEKVDQRQVLASRMEKLANDLRNLDSREQLSQVAPRDLVDVARKIYAARRSIDKIFGLAGFAVSPGWDIMLDLYQSHANGRRDSVSSASIGAACPPTTALRWLKVLDTMGLIDRAADPNDQRRVYVKLTSNGIARVERSLVAYI
jgi:hypothetical protein